MDHFYLTDPTGGDAPILGYEPEGITGYVYTTPEPGYISLYRLYHNEYDDHFYTTNEKEADEAVKGGYLREGITCYVHSNPSSGFVPLYRLYNITTGDHFYTTNVTEVNKAIKSSGYNLESLACYVGPHGYRNAVPLYRWHKTGLLTNFTFNKAYTKEQKNIILRRHNYIFGLLGTCTHISKSEQSNLKKIYREAIHHDFEKDPNRYGSADLNGRTLYLNLKKLHPLGDLSTELTIIHEMMHCAGYTHPNPRSCTNNPATGDCPGDGGPYYGSAPLRAELCVTHRVHSAMRNQKTTILCYSKKDKFGMS